MTDASTLQTISSNRSRSPSASEASVHTNDALDRQRLRPDEARSRFLPSRVDARDADFSDRINEQRKSYKSHIRTRRKDGLPIEAEDENQQDWSDQEPEESLAKKVARLTREVQEVQSEHRRLQNEHNSASGIPVAQTSVDQDITALSEALDNVLSSRQDAVSAHARLTTQLSQQPTLESPPPATLYADNTSQGTNAIDQVDAHTLSQIADFDARLTLLEQSLGLDSLDPVNNLASSVIPILPNLSLLDKHVTFLTSSDTSAYLDELAQSTTAPRRSNSSTLPNAPTTISTNTLAPQSQTQTSTGKDKTDAEDLSKLRALYALLPSISAASPTLPPLLARLRSLHSIHAGAAIAHESLDELEQKQADAQSEMTAWRNGLTQVSAAITSAEAAIASNVQTVNEWVKTLETKLKSINIQS